MLLALDPRLARRVGAVTLLALALTSAGFLFLAGRLRLGAPVQFRVLFRHSAGLVARAPLVVGGTPIGRVSTISPVPHGAAGPLAGQVGVAVTVEINPADVAKVPRNAAIFIALRGALSDRYLEVAPPPGAPEPPIADGAVMRGVDPPRLDDVLTRVWVSLTTIRLFADTLRPELSALRDQLDRLRRDFAAIAPRAAERGPDVIAATRGLVSAARATRDSALGGDRGIDHVLAIAGDAGPLIAQLRRSLAALDPEIDATLDQLARIHGHVATREPLAHTARILVDVRRALDRADTVLATAAEITGRIADGEGTIGRLMGGDPSFPEDIKDFLRHLKRHPWQLLVPPLN